MKKILVIGGNGFIGKNIVKLLGNCGYELGVYDLQKVQQEDVVSYQGDVIHDLAMGEIIKQYDTIIYLISAITPQRSMDEPISTYLTDIPLLLHVLQLCVQNGIKQVIYASSGGTVYGDNDQANSEDIYCQPNCHYGIGKQTCENILLLYNRLFNMQNIILRISNPYGKYQDGKNGVGVITAMALKAIKEKRIEVWGDGENIRDFIAIEDVANGFKKAVEWNFNKALNPIFNIGSGKPTKINEIVNIICSEIEGVKVTYSSKRDFDVRCNYLDGTKSKEILGFEVSKNNENNIRNYIRGIKNDNEL